jgi:hypothetical protein
MRSLQVGRARDCSHRSAIVPHSCVAVSSVLSRPPSTRGAVVRFSARACAACFGVDKVGLHWSPP